MRELKLSRLIRIGLLPALMAGASLSAQAQSNSAADKDKGQTSATEAKGDATTTNANTYRGLRASEMIDMSVINPKGDNIGQISDMIVNMKTGDVRYAILKFDPGILQGEELYAVPTTELRIAADRNDVVYDMSETKLERARIDRDDWNDGIWDDPDYVAKLDKANGVKQPARSARAHRASDLIGKDVNSKSGEKIGELEELIVNMAQQKVHYAVLEFDPSWASSEQNYAFPLTSFKLTDGKDELALDITKDKLAAMKSFSDSRYDNLNDSVWVADIDRYFITVLPALDGTKTAAKSGTNDDSANTLFARLDENKNGSLSKTEVEDTADVDHNWTSFDKNDDDRISREEFTSSYTVESK